MAEPYILTEHHYLAFGVIMQHFARFERLVEGSISHILAARHGLVALTISGLGYSAKCEALSSLLKATQGPPGYAETVLTALDDFNDHAGLRNAIAHHPWKQGTRPDSITHLSISSRGGKVKAKGMSPDDRDYTLDELTDIANGLLEIHDKLTAYLISSGMWHKAAASTEDRSSSS